MALRLGFAWADAGALHVGVSICCGRPAFWLGHGGLTPARRGPGLHVLVVVARTRGEGLHVVVLAVKWRCTRCAPLCGVGRLWEGDCTSGGYKWP